MTDPARESQRRRIEEAIKASVGPYIEHPVATPPVNFGISSRVAETYRDRYGNTATGRFEAASLGISNPPKTRRYLDINAKDTQYMFHEDNIFIGQNVRITDNGTVQVFECAGRSDTDPECAILLKDGVFHSKTVRFDRLTLVPIKTQSEFPDGYKGMSPIGLTQDEATEQFAFYMVMAQRMFEMMPRNLDAEGEDTTRDEVERLMVARGESKTGSAVVPALAFYDASIAWYEEDNKKWGD